MEFMHEEERATCPYHLNAKCGELSPPALLTLHRVCPRNMPINLHFRLSKCKWVHFDETYRILTVHGTVKLVLPGHSKTDTTKILMTNGSLMKVESGAFCNTIDLH